MEHFEQQQAFVDWYADAWPDLTSSLTAAFGGNRSVAADAAAEACAIAFERWTEVSAFENPTGWAYTVATRIGRRLERRVRVDRRIREKLARSSEPSPVLDSSWIELTEIVGGLPARQRDVVVLRYFLQMTQKDIAEVLGVAPGTVAASLNQARGRLEPILNPDQSQRDQTQEGAKSNAR